MILFPRKGLMKCADLANMPKVAGHRHDDILISVRELELAIKLHGKDMVFNYIFRHLATSLTPWEGRSNGD